MPLHMLEEKLNRELLRYAVGRAIFCPSCEKVLDIGDAVLMMRRDGGATAVLCGTDYDRMRDRLSAVDDAAFLAAVEITDGRSKR